MSSQSAHPNKTLGVAAILINVLFWGIAPAIIKYGLDSVSPEVFLYYRFLIAIVLTTPVAFILRASFKSVRTLHDILLLAFIGIFSTLNLGVLFLGVAYTTSSAAALIAGTIPLFVIIGSALFLKERITFKEILGSVIAMGGTALIVAQTPVQQHADNPLLGNLIIVVYNVLWTTGILFMKKYAHKYSPFVFGYTGWLLGFLFFGVVSLITSPLYVLRPLMITQMPDVFLPVLYMAIFGSIVAFTAYQLAQSISLLHK